MKTLIQCLLLTLALIPSLVAGLPEIKALKGTEEITVTETFSEPKITEYKYAFKKLQVTISENGKKLGTFPLTEEDAARIDEFLTTVKRGKKAGRGDFGHPSYLIQHENSGKVIGQWTYWITAPKESQKPVLPLGDLRKRLL